MRAGQVTDIQIPKTPSGQFRLKLSVDKRFHPIIRKDSKVSIETQGFVGNKYVDIAEGSPNSAECPVGYTLASRKPVSMAKLEQEGSSIVQSVQKTIKKADVAIQNFSRVGKNANETIVAMKPKITQMASNANAILAGVRHGQGAAGKILTDKSVGANVAATVANAKQATANFAQTSRQIKGMVSGIRQNDMPGIHKTVQNTQQLTSRINKAAGTFIGSQTKNQKMAKTVHSTIDQAQQAMGNLASDTEALKTNFLLRGFFNRRGFYNLNTITPNKYKASRFVKHPRVRVWIPATELFTSSSGDSPKLSQAGRDLLDQRMSTLVRYLPNNPIVVEGYSNSGPLDKQYLISRERATEVRNYLIQRFSLKPKRVGLMPLASQPPAKTGKKIWNGVCLVLVVSKRRQSLF